MQYGNNILEHFYYESGMSCLQELSVETMLLSSTCLRTILSLLTSTLPEIWDTSLAFHSPSGMTLAHAGKQLCGSEMLDMTDRIVSA